MFPLRSGPYTRASRGRSFVGWIVVFGILVVLGVCATVFLSKTGSHSPTSASARLNSNPAVAVPPVLPANAAAPSSPLDPRWNGVIGVLNAMKNWYVTNPVYHIDIPTKMGDKVYSETEIFRFKGEGSTNLVTRLRVHLRYPNPVDFLIEQQGQDILAYLPQTDQLVKVDAKQEILNEYGWNLQDTEIKSFLQLLRIAFVETNDNSRALTFAFKPEAMKLPAAAGDVYTTLRIDEQGALRTIEQTQLGERLVMRVNYVSFDQSEVARGAPSFPTDKPVLTGKPFKLALQEEIIKMREKGNLKI